MTQLAHSPVSENGSDITQLAHSPVIEAVSNWTYAPDSVLLHIFQFLSPKELLNAGLVCSSWCRLSYDQLLWKHLLYRNFSIDPSVSISPGHTSWVREYQRLVYHTPLIQTEVLRDHSHQVLHVSFAQCGSMFATCSKDGYILVWQAEFPSRIVYSHDMKSFSWKYTQYSQFNESDTLLLVSGVHFGTPHSTSGEIAVFGLQEGFPLQCRVMNKPYDIFGTWFSDEYLLSGDLHWLAHFVSTSIVWLNKASQETSSEHVPIMNLLYRFYNSNASSIRAVMVTNCLAPMPEFPDSRESSDKNWSRRPESAGQRGNPPSHRELNPGLRDKSPVFLPNLSRPQYFDPEGTLSNCHKFGESLDYASPIKYSAEYRQFETQQNATSDSEDITPTGTGYNSTGRGWNPRSIASTRTKLGGKLSGVRICKGGEPSGVRICKGGEISGIRICKGGEPLGVIIFKGGEPLGVRICKGGEPSGIRICRGGEPSGIIICRGGEPSGIRICRGGGEPSGVRICKAGEPLGVRICKDDASENSSEASMELGLSEKYLIFTTGSKTYTPHQVGFKRVRGVTFPRKMSPGPTLSERLARRAAERENSQRPDPNWLVFEEVADRFDKVDHLIDLHGHIIGMGLSPDHRYRYLYVNTRPWPHGYTIENPLDPPPIAQEIDIHVIDLVTLKEVGTMLRSHKAYTPNNECFFIFLDVCHQYVARCIFDKLRRQAVCVLCSGAEDRHGYLWDRHYGACLTKFPHNDVVNAVAFNPRDSEMLVTTSDDFTVKVWRSRRRVLQLGLDPNNLTKGTELRRK
uniref:F-box domain-containing protein n=1 Tax=Timema genevievae TaxID=629358 RepID=A0A7R9PLB2_TIMGE|nr:unnamed protein product [Timema genevievae]